MSVSAVQLSPPTVSEAAIMRVEVTGAIDKAMRKDILFMHAPAGYGKTVAMSMWLSSGRINSAWIPLTAYDNESVIFCRYLISALIWLKNDISVGALNSPRLIEAPFEYMYRLISMMGNSNEKGIIILDDFHLIDNPAILKALPLVIKKISQYHKLVFISRLSPPVYFFDLALKEQLAELNENHLRFTGKQILELYNSFGIDISLEEAVSIETKTGGWALGLGAELLSARTDEEGSFLGKVSSERYIDRYFESEIWDRWDADTKEFLLRTSILENLYPELCEELYACDSERLLFQIMNNSGLVVRLSDGSFRYHHILRDFLRRKAAEEAVDLTDCYITSAEYMFKQGMLNAAFDYYMKSGNNDVIIRFLERIVDYGATTGSVEEYYDSINSFLMDKIPIEIIESNPFMLAPCVWAGLMCGSIERFQYWHSKLQRYLDPYAKDVDPRFLATITLFQFPNPMNSPRTILDFASKRLNSMIFESVPSPSVTYNFPFFHRGHRDYADLTDDYEELVPKYIAAFDHISNNAISLIMDGVISGILYEQNKLESSKAKAMDVLAELDEHSHPELRFAVYMHLAVIAFAENDEKTAWIFIDEVQSFIEQKALYLLKNLYAVKTKYRLYKGDNEAAEEWLSRYDTGTGADLRLFELYQMITTIRARIAIGEYATAQVLLVKTEKMVIDYRRPIDEMEILLLRSIAFWMNRQLRDAVESIKKAVQLAQPYHYVRIFANEGAVVIPILQKLYNQLLSNAAGDEMLIFVRNILLLTNKSAAIYPGFSTNFDSNSIKLSKQQKRMLELIASGKNNRQICEDTGLKLNTVKAHLYKLYEKLDVHSATEAVLKSYQYGIIKDNTE